MEDERRKIEYEQKRAYMKRMLYGDFDGIDQGKASSFVDRVRANNGLPGISISPASRLRQASPDQLKEISMEDITTPKPADTTPPDPGNIILVEKYYHQLERQAAAFRMICDLEKSKVKNFNTVRQLIESIFLLHASLGQVLDVLHFLDKQTCGMLEYQKRQQAGINPTDPFPVVQSTGYIEPQNMQEIENRVIRKFFAAAKELGMDFNPKQEE